MIDNQVYVLMYKLQSRLTASDILIDVVRVRDGQPEFINVTMLAYHLVDSWEIFNA